MKLPRPKNPIRGFAVICVAVIAAYIMWMGYKLNDTLSGPSWCSTAIGADRADADSKLDVAASCVGLLTIQLKSLATNSHILFGVVALCLLTLIVIVIAGGRVDLSASKSGVTAHIGQEAANAAANAADATAQAAEEKAAEIKTEVQPAKFTAPPGEQL